MADAVCDTSPLQYLHQLELLHVLPRLVGRILVPPAVVDELFVGRDHGLDLPDPTTLGLLLDAKRAGLIPEVVPRLDRLQALGFRHVLDLATEAAG